MVNNVAGFIMTRYVARIGLSLIFMAVFQPVASAVECGSRDRVVKILKQKHKETQVAGGFSNNQMSMEVYASKNGETWTILYTSAEGVSCIVAEGTAFYKMKPKPVEDPES